MSGPATAPVADAPERGSAATTTKAVLTLFLALVCGFLTFNFHWVLRAAHVHVSLSHHHRTTAFCAFTQSCKLSEHGQGKRRDLCKSHAVLSASMRQSDRGSTT